MWVLLRFGARFLAVFGVHLLGFDADLQSASVAVVCGLLLGFDADLQSASVADFGGLLLGFDADL